MQLTSPSQLAAAPEAHESPLDLVLVLWFSTTDRAGPGCRASVCSRKGTGGKLERWALSWPHSPLSRPVSSFWCYGYRRLHLWWLHGVMTSVACSLPWSYLACFPHGVELLLLYLLPGQFVCPETLLLQWHIEDKTFHDKHHILDTCAYVYMHAHALLHVRTHTRTPTSETISKSWSVCPHCPPVPNPGHLTPRSHCNEKPSVSQRPGYFCYSMN